MIRMRTPKQNPSTLLLQYSKKPLIITKQANYNYNNSNSKNKNNMKTATTHVTTRAASMMTYCYVTAAALTSSVLNPSSGATAATAFQATPSYSSSPMITNLNSRMNHHHHYHHHYPISRSYNSCAELSSDKLILNSLTSNRRYQQSSTRLFFSNSNKNDEDKSILKKVSNKVKDFIPFLKKKEKSQLTKKEQTKNELSSSIDTMLKDAPLGVRMMGKMVSPIITSVAGNIAQAMEEQTKQMSNMLDDARMYIVSDSSAIMELGEPIEVGAPFSQSSRSMNVNGKSTSSLNASFEVRGSKGGGTATIDATDGNIDRMVLNVNGRTLNINVNGGGGGRSKTNIGSSTTSSYNKSRGSTSSLGKNRNFSDDDIIDAEFVEKKK